MVAGAVTMVEAPRAMVSNPLILIPYPFLSPELRKLGTLAFAGYLGSAVGGGTLGNGGAIVSLSL